LEDFISNGSAEVKDGSDRTRQCIQSWNPPMRGSIALVFAATASTHQTVHGDNSGYPTAGSRASHRSSAGRQAIAAAQRRRWAEQNAAGGGSAAKAKKPEGKPSPAGRAAIVATLKKPWAPKKAEGAKPTAKTTRAKAA
jgi:hypothetical protein